MYKRRTFGTGKHLAADEHLEAFEALDVAREGLDEGLLGKIRGAEVQMYETA